MTDATSLYELCMAWNESSTVFPTRPNYVALLQHIERHAELRYGEYGPYAHDAQPFLARLHKWLSQVAGEQQRRTLLELVSWIMFLDSREMEALYRDVFRRIIVPWVLPADFPLAGYLSANYDHELLVKLRQFDIYSITDSFQHKLFENTNGLSGLRKPVVLGENTKLVPNLIARSKDAAGVIILEDVVGTGRQAARVLRKVAASLEHTTPVLFAPLVALEMAFAPGAPLSKLKAVTTAPATTIPSWMCLTETPHSDEPALFKRARAVVKATKDRVMERLNETDDEPDDPFGFGGAGALLVTHQNTPNNTLPLIHHRGPRWEALFRRLHHSYHTPVL